MVKDKLDKINGNEIIDFLNQQTRDSEDFEDTNICFNSFVFVDQKTTKTKYELSFDLDYNNWGTDQTIDENSIIIDNKGQVTCNLQEPFEGDGTDDVIEEALSEWIKTHEFNFDPEHTWQEIMREIYEALPQIGFNDKKGMQEQIDALTKAKTYMK